MRASASRLIVVDSLLLVSGCRLLSAALVFSRIRARVSGERSR